MSDITVRVLFIAAGRVQVLIQGKEFGPEAGLFQGSVLEEA